MWPELMECWDVLKVEGDGLLVVSLFFAASVTSHELHVHSSSMRNRPQYQKQEGTHFERTTLTEIQTEITADSGSALEVVSFQQIPGLKTQPHVYQQDEAISQHFTPLTCHTPTGTEAVSSWYCAGLINNIFLYGDEIYLSDERYVPGK